MTKVFLILAAQIVAFWPVWRWYGRRLTDSSDELWGLLALFTALFFLFFKKNYAVNRGVSLLPSFLILVVYALTYSFLPPIAHAAMAFTALGITLSSALIQRRFSLGFLGLLYLSLPLIPSLQFYGGYPLRVVVASITAPLLRVGGFNVIQEGTCLSWAGNLIWIDAPCSGIRMLWVGLYLAFTLICFYAIHLRKSIVILTLVVGLIIAGNVFRAVALFYFEAGILEMPARLHDYVGFMAFLLVAVGIVTVVLSMKKDKCEEQRFTY